MIGRGYREIPQHFPEPGWVEHDPEEIWASVEQTAAEALADSGVAARPHVDRDHEPARDDRRLGAPTGRPVHPAIVWQDRRTAERCAELPAALIRERTGLVPDPYFSATKLEWILARVEQPQRSLRSGRSTPGSSGS